MTLNMGLYNFICECFCVCKHDDIIKFIERKICLYIERSYMYYNDLFYLSKTFDEYKEINPSCIINYIDGHNITTLLPLFCKLDPDLILKRLEKMLNLSMIESMDKLIVNEIFE